MGPKGRDVPMIGIGGASRLTIDANITLSLLKTPKATEILEFFGI
jgi:hypothetical protein